MINGKNLDLVAREPVIPPPLVRNLDPKYYSSGHHQRQCYSEEMASSLVLETEGSDFFRIEIRTGPQKELRSGSFFEVCLQISCERSSSAPIQLTADN